ncbi:MAG: hypothetical protein ACKOX5_03695, partial [Bacteroidota bacterium]
LKKGLIQGGSLDAAILLKGNKIVSKTMVVVPPPPAPQVKGMLYTVTAGFNNCELLTGPLLGQLVETKILELGLKAGKAAEIE